ncbi:beclin, partial [Tremellales sp. Uapishka_1]
MASSSRQQDAIRTYTCERCRQPLILDPSISSITPSQYALIQSALPAPTPPSDLSPSSKLAALPPSARSSSQIWDANKHRGVAESFVLLNESTVLPHSPTTPHGLANNLHALLSERTPISHPLCTDCTSLLQSQLQSQLDELAREREAYIAFEQGILKNRDGRKKKSEGGLGEHDIVGTEEEWEYLTKRKEGLRSEEEELRKILEEKENELKGVREEEDRVRKEEEEMNREETEFLLSHASLSTQLKHLDHQLQTAKTHLLLSTSLLQTLETTNVYDDVFQIGSVPLSKTSTMKVGTINGLRLGGRPLVDWEEINAAWGLVALAIDRLAANFGLVFQTYKIIPLGSFSRIEEVSGKGVYELFASSDLSRLLQNRRFNIGLVALLDCLRQLVEYGSRQDRGWILDDMVISKDKIHDYSIRLPGFTNAMPGLPSMSIMALGSNPASSGNQGDEGWTKACKAVLGVLKRILRVESESNRGAV